MFAAIKSALGIKDWPEYTRAEVAAHNTEDSVWLVAGERVFDVTRFVHLHPAGPAAILKRAGGCEDCTMDYKFHSKGARSQWKECQVGVLKAEELKAPVPPNAAPDPAMVKRHEEPINYHGTFYSSKATVVATAAAAAVTLAQASTAAAANVPKQEIKKQDDADDEASRGSVAIHTSRSPAGDDGGEHDEHDGGEDPIAVGHCCRGGAPSDACKTCPNAPRCVRSGSCDGDCVVTARNNMVQQVGADRF